MTSGYIFNLKKYAVHDGPGIRTTVFMQGCPLDCWWCHNPESRQTMRPGTVVKNEYNCLRPYYRKIPYQEALKVTVDEIMRELRKDLIFYEESGGGATFSGGEPLMQPEFLHQLLQACKNENIHTAVDTSGYADWQLYKKILPAVDLFLFDLKIIDQIQHKKYIGVSNKRILENLHKLLGEDKDIYIRIPLIPGITDTQLNLHQIADYLNNLPKIKRIDLLPYNPMGEEKYNKLKRNQKLANLKHQKDRELKDIQAVFKACGFEVYIGG
ncbi:MAG: glycyl-radical enzyme activating protein [Calditrichae bacterium]|nr:glycyl-radical enzyme activating protein [Calditrichia bacterium]